MEPRLEKIEQSPLQSNQTGKMCQDKQDHKKVLWIKEKYMHCSQKPLPLLGCEYKVSMTCSEETFHYIQVVWMELNLYNLSDIPVHMPGFVS